MARLRLGVLISGRGSNLQALIDACAAPDYPAEIAVVISDRADAAGLKRAEVAGLATKIVPRSDYDRRESFENALDVALKGANVGLVCLAGFMRVLGVDFLAHWPGRLINIHPSLLPAFPGLDTHRRALESGAEFSGCTVHYVVAEVDAGPIVLQEKVPILPGDTETSLAARVLDAEHRVYPQAVKIVARNLERR